MPAELLYIVTKECEHQFPFHGYLLLFALKSILGSNYADHGLCPDSQNVIIWIIVIR